MNGLRNSLWILAVLCVGASAAPRMGSSLLQGLLRDSRAAYFRGEYEESMRLAMEVLLEDPVDSDAGDLLRQSARILADRELDEVKRERRELLESARKLNVERERRRAREDALRQKESEAMSARLAEVEKARPEWSAWTRAYLAHGEFLEAYRLIFLVKDQFPKEQWAGLQLERVSAAVERDMPELEVRPAWYREAVLGYQAFAAGRLAEADKLWRSALQRPGSETYPYREAIVTRLRETGSTAPPPIVAPREPERATKPAALSKPPASRRRPATALRPPAAAPEPVAPPPAPEAPSAKEVEALYVQGLVHYGMGHIADAVRSWEKVLQLDPKHPAAQRALARAKLELGGKR